MPITSSIHARHLRLLLIVACSVTTNIPMAHATTLAAATHSSASTAATPRNPAAVRADAMFWQLFHSGDYAHIQAALETETGAHLRDPGDSTTTAHVGFLHIWRLSERARQTAVAPSITDDAMLARSYFQRAANKVPDDARYQGFLASAMLAEASIQHDPELQQQAQQTMQQAIKAWPAFNLFTAGYVMSNLDATNPGFQRALAWQWKNLDVCTRALIDRHHPDIAQMIADIEAVPANSRDRRACNESAIAPHNQEGFFLNMGDMLVKSGDWKVARAIYAAAKSTPGYASWPFQHELEQRIADAPANVARFNASVAPGNKPPARMMLNSTFACMACHQQQIAK